MFYRAFTRLLTLAARTFFTHLEILASGACLAVFPEDISHTESQLTPLQTGTR